MDLVFLADMFVTFFSSHQTEDFEVIDDHSEIAMMYLTGHFWIDLLAILPFQHMVSYLDKLDSEDRDAGSFGFVRIFRISRLSKFLKLLKLFRVAMFFKR